MFVQLNKFNLNEIYNVVFCVKIYYPIDDNNSSYMAIRLILSHITNIKINKKKSNNFKLY